MNAKDLYQTAQGFNLAKANKTREQKYKELIGMIEGEITQLANNGEFKYKTHLFLSSLDASAFKVYFQGNGFNVSKVKNELDIDDPNGQKYELEISWNFN